MGVCGAGVEPTWQTRQVAASVALLCVCQMPVAVAAIKTARNAAQISTNVARGLVGPRFIMVETTSPPIILFLLDLQNIAIPKLTARIPQAWTACGIRRTWISFSRLRIWAIS
jgi:hypothetical protein